MKRPLFVMGTTVLSGITAGLNEAKGNTKAAVCLAGIAVAFAAHKKSRERKPSLLFCVLLFVLFTAGFIRSSLYSKSLDTPEKRLFYEKYRAANPGEFDYALYLKSMGVETEEERKALKETDPENAGILERFSLKCALVLEDRLTEHDAGIYKAMLLGNKGDMDEEVKSLYQKSGIAHLLAVSGLHVSLIGSGIQSILFKTLGLPVFFSSAAAAAAALIYAFFTGASGSALRAAFMLSLSLFAVPLGRRADLLSSLSLSLIILLFINPFLVLQSGFQLSFLAILGIFISQEIKETTDAPDNGILKKLRDSVLPSACVTFTTLPVICTGYYQFPLLCVFLNVLVIPLMTGCMISGLTVLLSGLAALFFAGKGLNIFAGVSAFLSSLSAAPGHYILRLYEILCDFTQRLPFSVITTGKPGFWGIVLYCLFMYGLFYIITEKPAFINTGKRALLAVPIALLSVSFLFVPKERGFYVECLDVSQGDCFHIHSGDTDILIDGGSQGYEKVGKNVIESCLLSKGITGLDAVIVSHADADHVNGLYYLLSEESEIDVKKLILPAAAIEDEKYERLKESFSDEQNTVYAQKGMKALLNGGSLTCIYSAPFAGKDSDTNRQSSVFLLNEGGFTMLFTGDITEKEEKEIINEYRNTDILKNLNVLKVSHHGSDTASCDEFIGFTNPSLAVLSYKKGNSYGHPDIDVCQRFKDNGTGLLETAECGAVKIYIKKGFLMWEPFIKERRR